MSARLLALHSACWKAGPVAMKVVRPTALPTLAMEASSRKCWGKKGVRNSQLMHAVKRREVWKRSRCGWQGSRALVGGVQGEGVVVEALHVVYACGR
jgi:hypothetical protein